MKKELSAKDVTGSLKITRYAYGVFLLLVIYQLVNSDIENATINLGIALIFDPFDQNVAWKDRPLKRLRDNLLTGIVIATLITLAYLLLCLYISEWLVYTSLSILIVFNIFIIADSWKLYAKTPSIIKVSHSLKEEIELHYNSFNRWWKLQQKISLFIYPIAISGGFILGGSVGSGKPVEEFLYNSVMLGTLVITIIVFMPICYFFARWMFNHTYGKHLKQLKSTIDELE